MLEEMIHISKEQFARICSDYKEVYIDYDGTFPKRIGRRVAFLPGYGTILFTEGIHFLVDGDYAHLPVLCKENAEVGAAYRDTGGYQIVLRIYRISEEYAHENKLMCLDRVETNTGDFALLSKKSREAMKREKQYVADPVRRSFIRLCGL